MQELSAPARPRGAEHAETAGPTTSPEEPAPRRALPHGAGGTSLPGNYTTLQQLHQERALMNKCCTRVVLSRTSAWAKHWTRGPEASAVTHNLNKLHESGAGTRAAGTTEP